MKMEKILKLIPTVALVSVIGVALANQGQQDLCTQLGTQGYVKTLPTSPDPTLSPADEILAGNMNDVGQFGTNFECTGITPEACHWVYNAEEPDPSKRWTKCNGNYERITP